MILRGERVAAEYVPGWLALLARHKLALVRGEVAVGSPDIDRLGLIVLALALQTIVNFSPGHFRPAGNSLSALLVTGGTLASLAVSLLATLPQKQLFDIRARRTFAVMAIAGLGILSVVGAQKGITGVAAIVRGTPYGNDGAVMDLYAAKRVAEGHSPYIKTNIVTALAAINAPSTTTTPLMRGQFLGTQAYPSEAAIQQVFLNALHFRSSRDVPIPSEFESKYNYPAGSFLFILPFVWAGINDMRFLYALALVAMGAYLCWRMPRSLRPLVPALLLADVPLVQLTAGGQPDPIYALFLMVGYAEWTSPWLSPLTMGLAIGTKQLAWFFVPFYLILVIRRYGWREGLRRSGLLALVFLVMNGPFIAQTPDGYLSSVSAPMADPMFPLGIGAIALFVSGTLPMLPKLAFTVTELAVWVGSMLAVVRTRYLTAASGVVLAALPLFFAWRSLVNYFYLVPLLALAVALATDHRAHHRDPAWDKDSGNTGPDAPSFALGRRRAP